MRLREPGLVDEAEARRRAEQDDRRRADRLRVAMSSGLPELSRDDLTFGRFITHEPTGEFFLVMAGEPAAHKDAFDAWYVERTGDVTFLERPASGPKTRDELAAHRAARKRSAA